LGGVDPAGDSGGEFGGGSGGDGVGVGVGDVGYGYLGFVVFLFVAGGGGGGGAFFGPGFAGGRGDGGVVGFFVAVGHDNYYLLKQIASAMWPRWALIDDRSLRGYSTL